MVKNQPVELPFTKMQGLGNDFAVVDCREKGWGDWANLAPRLAHRRFGVGCDQVLLLGSSAAADFRLDIYNSDGSRAEMCGNGIRCLARYVREKEITGAEEIRFETLAGIITACHRECDVEVDMGEPEFEGRRIPADADGPVLQQPLSVGEGAVQVTCVSMGNPHAVVFVDDAESYPVEEVGPLVECHPFFPKRTNVEFVQVMDPGRLRMRVWERGAGITMACGTGACAAVVASKWTGRTGPDVAVLLDGGELSVRWDRRRGRVYMTGPAVTVFEGRFYL
jgi:diaminopimelate epimerase